MFFSKIFETLKAALTLGTKHTAPGSLDTLTPHEEEGQGARTTSSGIRILNDADAQYEYRGWHEAAVAEWQDTAYRDLLADMYKGDVRLDLQVAADAVRDTDLPHPRVLEIGCGSGYYSEVLAHLCQGTVRYSGLDYSSAMIQLARDKYPGVEFLVGDATHIDLPDDAFDVVFNGAALMHMPDYEKAVAESRRVSSAWCIYHTVPLLNKRPTTVITKKAYGSDVLEIVFNRADFEQLLSKNQLTIVRRYESIHHNYLNETVGEPVTAFTYLCRVQ